MAIMDVFRQPATYTEKPKMIWALDLIPGKEGFNQIDRPDDLNERYIIRMPQGPGPKRWVTRMKLNGDDEPKIIDLYDNEIAMFGESPRSFFAELMQKELEVLTRSKPSLWTKAKAGLYITVLIVLIIVVFLIFVLLMGN